MVRQNVRHEDRAVRKNDRDGPCVGIVVCNSVSGIRGLFWERTSAQTGHSRGNKFWRLRGGVHVGASRGRELGNHLEYPFTKHGATGLDSTGLGIEPKREPGAVAAEERVSNTVPDIVYDRGERDRVELVAGADRDELFA